MSLEPEFRSGKTFDEFVDGAGEHGVLLRAVERRTVVTAPLSAKIAATGRQWHLLVMTEDWCGDSVNSLPVIARLAADAGNVDLRIVSREANPALMNSHLAVTGARAIPVVILLDESFEEKGWWGSRPRALQAEIDAHWKALSKADRYVEVRRWYVADRGVSTAEEIAALLLGIAAREPVASTQG